MFKGRNRTLYFTAEANELLVKLAEQKETSMSSLLATLLKQEAERVTND